MMKASKRLVYRATGGGDADARVCVFCGCIIAHKARLASETCPDRDLSHPELNRWGEKPAPFHEPPVANDNPRDVASPGASSGSGPECARRSITLTPYGMKMQDVS